MDLKSNFYKYKLFLISIFIILWFNSCSLLSGFQDGRSIGKNNVEAIAALSTTRLKNFFGTESNNDENGSVMGIPSIEIGAKYGLTEKMDAALRINSAFSMMVGVKYQFLGDRNSKYAMGTGFDFSVFGFGPFTGHSLQIPINASYLPSEKVSLYFSPRAIIYWDKTDIFGFQPKTNLTVLGWNAGMLFGTKNKIGFDMGFAAGTITFGIGGKFLFIRQ